MTASRSRALELPGQDQGNKEVPGAPANRNVVAISSSGSTLVSTAHDHRVSSARFYHTAFMQCRTCCNCNSQCCYYGKGHFNAQGTYVGPEL